MKDLSTNIIELRSHALLVALQQRSTRETIPMVLVILVIGGLASTASPGHWVVIWVLCALTMQISRFYILPRLYCPESSGAKKRLDFTVALSFLGGLVLASSMIFFPAFNDSSRSIYTMIIFGVCTGNIVGSHGHLPTFLAFAVPQLVALTIGWLWFPLENISHWQHANVLLIAVLGVFLFNSSRDVFKAFEENCILTERLQSTLESETHANTAKTRFLASASHDLRQPLHTMSMLSAALRLRPLDEESAAIAKRIDDAMAELSAELDSLLDISKMDAGATRVNISRFPVNRLAERLVRDYRPAALRKSLNLSGQYSADPVVETDRVLFERTIRNLIDNAVKYTENGSIVVKVAEEDSMCVIQVIDTGVGIPESEQNRVYDEFYQLHNPERDRKNGLGLGLSIVVRIVSLLGANLQLESTPGAGSTFTLSIPSVVVPSLPECSAQQPSAVREYEQNKHRNLFSGVHAIIVEDNREVRQSMHTLLKTAGCRISEAVSSSEAIEIARTDPPDIILLDVRLPAGDSGYKTISGVRNLVPDVPVIIISGELIANNSGILKIDNCEYLVKPVNMGTLFGQMRRMLEQPVSS